MVIRLTLEPVAVVNFRTDERADRALAGLTADGTSVPEAIRQALVDAVRPRCQVFRR